MKTRLLLLPLTLFVMWAVFMFSPVQAITPTATAQNKQDDNKKKNKKQKKQEVTLKSAKGTATGKGASDPNIKEDEMPNDPNAKRQPPISKGGGTSKGASYDCEVRFDNRTDLNIKTYVNGRYRGTMGGYDDAYLYIYPGYITVYARADFSDGSYLYWGPQSYTCSENQYINFKMAY